VAELLGVPLETVAAATTDNAARLLGLPTVDRGAPPA
jgi:predicted amidohydrolase